MPLASLWIDRRIRAIPREQITSVEVHLSDNVGQKSVDGDNRVLMEARVTGYKPIAVSDHAATLHQSIGGAAEKLKRALDSAPAPSPKLSNNPTMTTTTSMPRNRARVRTTSETPPLGSATATQSKLPEAR